MASLAATAASNALSLDGFGIKWGGWNYPAWRKVQVRRRSCCTFSCDAIDLMIWISPARSCRESVLELMHRLGGELHTDVFTVVNLLITLGVLPRPPPRGTISSPGGVAERRRRGCWPLAHDAGNARGAERFEVQPQELLAHVARVHGRGLAAVRPAPVERAVRLRRRRGVNPAAASCVTSNRPGPVVPGRWARWRPPRAPV